MNVGLGGARRCVGDALEAQTAYRCEDLPGAVEQEHVAVDGVWLGTRPVAQPCMAPDAVGRHLTDSQIRDADRQIRVVGVAVARGKGGGEHLKAAVQQRRVDAGGVAWRQSSDRFAVAPPDVCYLLERRPVLQTVLRESAVERRRGNLFSATILD